MNNKLVCMHARAIINYVLNMQLKKKKNHKGPRRGHRVRGPVVETKTRQHVDVRKTIAGRSADAPVPVCSGRRVTIPGRPLAMARMPHPPPRLPVPCGTLVLLSNPLIASLGLPSQHTKAPPN